MGLSAFYPYNLEEINNVIDDQVNAVFILGNMADDKFIPKFVGRSENNLKSEVQKYLGDAYTTFQYENRDSDKDAFELESTYYHSYGGKEKLDNEKHPSMPDGADYDCPLWCDEV